MENYEGNIVLETENNGDVQADLDEINSSGNEGDGQDNENKKLFTQEELDRIVGERLKRDRQSRNAKIAEVEAFEKKLHCKEYLIDRRLPADLIDVIDTSDVESFKEKAGKIKEMFGRQFPAPMKSTETPSANGSHPAFAYENREYKPKNYY